MSSFSRGFLLMEALILILILSVVFVSFTGVLFQALKVSSRTRDLTKALSHYEELTFQLENGLRPDLAVYGGRGVLEKSAGYEIKNQKEENEYGFLHTRLFWKESSESLGFDFVVSQRGLE